MAERVTGRLINFSILGEEQFQAVMTNLENVADDMSDIYKLLVDDFYSYEKQNFSLEGAADGNSRWQELSIDYAKSKKKRGLPIMQLTGALMDSLTGPDAEGSVMEIKPLSFKVGTDLKIGRWCLGTLHQLGTRSLPVRELIRLSNERKKKWRGIIGQNLKRKVTTVRKGKTYVKEYGSGPQVNL